jgi:hypothetical protein
VVTSRWSAVDVLLLARVLPSAREIAETLIAGKVLRATRKQFKDCRRCGKYAADRDRPEIACAMAIEKAANEGTLGSIGVAATRVLRLTRRLFWPLVWESRMASVAMPRTGRLCLKCCSVT